MLAPTELLVHVLAHYGSFIPIILENPLDCAAFDTGKLLDVFNVLGQFHV